MYIRLLLQTRYGPISFLSKTQKIYKLLVDLYIWKHLQLDQDLDKDYELSTITLEKLLFWITKYHLERLNFSVLLCQKIFYLDSYQANLLKDVKRSGFPFTNVRLFRSCVGTKKKKQLEVQ